MLDAHHPPLTVVGGVVTAGSAGGIVCAVDEAPCEDVWADRTGNAVLSSPAIVGGDIFGDSNGGRLNDYESQESGPAITWLS